MRSLRLSLIALGTSMMLLGCGAAPTALPASSAFDAQAQAARKKQTIDEPTTENFTKVDAKLFRGGWPTEADMRKLAKMGVKTDICLLNPNAPKEKDQYALEKRLCKELGMTFLSLPLPWGEAPPASMIDSYLKTMHDADALPAYVHCHHGRDRTGTMVAVYRMEFYGYSGEKALDEMKSFGFKPKDYPFYADYVTHYKAPPAQKVRKEAAAAL
jgi:protein tyrosine/serine phosphatase